VGVAWSLHAACPVWAQTVPQEVQSTPSTELELLRAEILDTVSITNPIHFITPDVVDVVANPETYRIEPAESDRLKLVSQKGTRALVVDALVISHTYDITTPIALYVQDDEKFPHVVLLLPGGKGLEAVGSYDAIRTRGTGHTVLSPARLHEVYLQKRQDLQQRSAGPDINPSSRKAQ
jgi:hypothetical protein